MKPIRLSVFGTFDEYGQRITLQITSHRTGKRYAVGVELEDLDNSWAALEVRNRRLVRYAWHQLRGFFRAQRGGRNPIQAIHIEGKVSI